MLSADTQTALRELQPRRICLIKPSALGDVAQTLPLLAPLRRQFPQAALSWVVNRGFSPLLEGHPDLQEVIPFERHGSVAASWKLLRTLRSRQFDLTIDLQGLLRSGLMTLATGAPLRIGLEMAREGARLAYTHLLPQTGKSTPAYLRYWRLAEMLGLGNLPRRATVTYSLAEQSWVRDRLWGLPRPFIAVHPGARWETKRWPGEKFAEVCGRLSSEFLGSVLVIGNHNDWSLGAHIEREVFRRGGKVVNLAGHTSLKCLAALLEQMDVLISNDSGPLHLASELGTPVVGVYTSTNPAISGPAGPGRGTVVSASNCPPCYNKRCYRFGSERLICSRDLTTEQVAHAAVQFLREQVARVRSA